MYNTELSFSVKIHGCPESGLPAVDFRKANNLPAEPTNRFQIQYKGTSETLCRRFAGALNGNADLILVTSYGKPLTSCTDETIAMVAPACQSTRDNSFEGYHAVNASILQRWHATTQGECPDPTELLEALAECGKASIAARDAWRAERAAKDAQEKAESERRKEEYQQEMETKKANLANGTAAIREWATNYGSELLKARIKHEFSWETLAENEYAEWIMDAHGIASDLEDVTGVDETIKDRVAPTLEEIRLLENLQSRLDAKGIPQVELELVWAEDDGDEDESPRGRPEIRATITCPNDVELWRFYRVPSVK